MGLREYNAKRNFSKTREPAGGGKSSLPKTDSLFVVQKHDASRLHYDFRLQMDGVLKSWAVPKGFPTRKGDRRLAVEVEDHPLGYADFEGTIPPGNYGAGTVMVWDMGEYELKNDEPLRALKQGKLQLILKGRKLKGQWTLVRMRPREKEDKPQWLLLKSGDDLPPFSACIEDQSFLTKRSMEQIAHANDRQWLSNRGDSHPDKPGAMASPKSRALRPHAARVSTGPKIKSARLPASAPKINLPLLPKATPAFIEPMKARLVESLPKGSNWLYELKFDGVRALAIKTKPELSLISRAAKDLAGKYPEIVAALRELPAREFVLDGEVVAIDSKGRSSFQLLQSSQMAGVNRPPLFYYVFDLLNLEGKDLASLPLLKRKAMAEALLSGAPGAIRFSAGIKADSARVVKAMQARGLEGLIAKRKDSSYESGRRSGAWVKFKWTNEQEFVIGGYTRPQGSRTHFGALLAGYYQGNKLLFAAKVGTGFNTKLLAFLHQKFQKLVRPDCPFANLPEKLPDSGAKGITAADMRSCTWLEPRLVAQVRFAEWTRDHHLRQPSFLGLRDDKNPSEVVREKPA